VERVTIIESSLGTKPGDPLKDPLFALAHHWTFLKTIMQAPIYVFPSLVDNIHIMGPMNEITYTFNQLSTQLDLVGFRAKVSTWKL
jgi:hypothetical protein